MHSFDKINSVINNWRSPTTKMFSRISEQQMHRVRWVLTCAWLLLIASLFYDPVSPLITSPDQYWSPFRIKPEDCIPVQKSSC